MEIDNNKIITLYEFNNFHKYNYAYLLAQQSGGKKIDKLSINKNIPFRLTDITAIEKGHFTGINYFYKGNGRDTIYRPGNSDSINNNLVRRNNTYQNYCRLIDLSIKKNEMLWEQFWEFPTEWTGYNWEGIAAYKSGYFLINDRYTPTKPYRSTLIYLQKTEK